MRGRILILITALVFCSAPSLAQDADVEALRKEIEELRQLYESRLIVLESKLQEVQQEQAKREVVNPAAQEPASTRRTVRDNRFNPSIGVILNGTASHFSNPTSEIAGFAVGEEGERGPEGLSIRESELNFAANVDDKFAGALTVGLVPEDGSTVLELEEAYFETRPDLGLPTGSRLRVGRSFWELGYLNSRHTHEDDFVDRPLPYRAYLNKSYNDDGMQLSYVLPTDTFLELGGGLFRGDDYPFGTANGHDLFGVGQVFARIGGEFGQNQAWRLGGYFLSGKTNGRSAAEDTVTFVGDTDLFVADLRYTWAPTGNARERELILQGEFMHRREDGTYDDTNAGTGVVPFKGDSNGWYAQAVYKFLPNWRAGARVSLLHPASVPAGLVGSALDSRGHDPSSISAMLDWTNTEFSRIRLQYNHEELSNGETDDQIWLQYIMAIGAHGAHPF